ncbi:MAG: hypothetical protein ACP5K5_03080, partial [Candidatus Micrarchaeia archaeon]
MERAQSAVEFLTAYSWVIFIIAVVLFLLYMFVSVPSTIVPSVCSFESGVYCNDLILATNSTTHSSSLLLLVTNTQPYPIENASIYVDINGLNTSPENCQPNIVGAGSELFCNLKLPMYLPFNKMLSGNLYIKANYCGLNGMYTATKNCTVFQKEIYTGGFSAHAQYVNFSKPFVMLSFIVPSNSLPAGGNETVYARLSFMGLPIKNAEVTFSTSEPGMSAFLPQISTTNATGIASAKLIGYDPASVTVSASYAGMLSTANVLFFPRQPPSYIFCVAGESATKNVNASYFAPITSNGIGAWKATTSYPSRVFTESCSEYNDYAYCVDGLNSTGLSNQSFFAPISESGIGAWSQSVPYPVKTYYQSCPIYDGKMYCIGGITNQLLGTATNSAYYSNVTSHGFSPWSSTSSYLISIYGQSCIAANNSIYCIAGALGGGNVYYAPITSNGIGAWKATTSYP